MLRFAAFSGLIILLSSIANAQSGCPQGTFSVVNSPDGSTLSILFDDFSVTAGAGKDTDRKVCSLTVPLNLAEGYSLGVYKVDYRGFARLFSKQYSELTVDYALGPKNKSRKYNRKVKGPSEGDFVFMETIGAGLMKRVGCGDAAVLNVAVTLQLQSGGAAEELIGKLRIAGVDEELLAKFM